MFIDWSQPPKSLNDFWSGKYYENWTPRIAQTLRFNRDKWVRRHANSGVSYVYDGKAEVDLDCDSNLTGREDRLRFRVLMIRYIRVYPPYRRQGVMTHILEELIEQFPNSDLLAVLSPQEGDREEGVRFMKRTYERLNFIEIDWSRYLTMNEHFDFLKRCENKRFTPTLMCHIGGGDENAKRLWEGMRVESVVSPNLDCSEVLNTARLHHDPYRLQAPPSSRGLRT